MVRRLVARLLSEFTVVSATDGESGLERWKEGAFDLVISDMAMPRIDGREVHRRLSLLSPAAAAQMLFLTSGAFTPDGQAFLASMRERVIWKPIDAAELRAKVTAALRRSP